MKLSKLHSGRISEQLATNGLHIRLGTFTVCLRTRLQRLATLISEFYGEYPLADNVELADFHVSVNKPNNLRRWWRQQVIFQVDGRPPFEPFPADNALPLLEWGVNWCVATRAHQYLMLHSAVLEKNGKAVIFPAHPGCGKSTLCAALMLRGWRLFSDEFGLIGANGLVYPLLKPVALKNESIEVIRDFSPDAYLGPLFPNTRKGTVAHLRANDESIGRMDEPALPSHIVFPFFRAGVPLKLESNPKSRSFIKLAHNAFNYEVLGLQGFQLVSDLIRSCQCFKLSYSDLDEVIDNLDALVA